MSGQCFTPAFFCALRAARLDVSGVPDPGADSVFVSDKGLTLGYQVQVETGQRIFRKGGCGATIVDFKDCDRISGVTLNYVTGVMNFEELEILTAGTLFTDGAAAVGFALRDPAEACPDGVSIEGWVKALEGQAHALHPISGKPAYFRLVWPKVTWAINGEQRFGGDDSTDTSLTGTVTANENFHDGPANDLPVFSGAMLIFLDDSDGLPVADCSYQTLVAS